MNNNVTLEKTTIDKKAEKEIQKQKEYKAGYIACCVGMILSLAMNIFTGILAVDLSLLGTTASMILMGICFPYALTLSITSKKARALYIVLAAMSGIFFIGEVVSFICYIIGML